MPSLGAHTPDGPARSAFRTITAAVGRIPLDDSSTVHGRAPQVQATILGAVDGLIAIAKTGGIFCKCRSQVAVVQVLDHPHLGIAL